MRKIFTVMLVMLIAFTTKAQIDSKESKNLKDEKELANTHLQVSKSMEKTRISKDVVFFDDFESLTGWTLEPPFEIGTATTLPATAHSGTEILGGPLNANYDNNQVQVFATSPVIDCSAEAVVILSYWSFSGCESANWDHIGIEAFDGSAWSLVWSNAEWGGSVQQDTWTYYEFDVSTHAAGNANFQVRYYLGATDESANYSGWGIDDFMIFTPEDNDLGINTITPNGLVLTGSTITPTVTIENYGGVAQSTYDITLVSDPAGYSETISNPGTIEPGATLTIDFPDWSPTDGSYTLTATVVLADDANSENDIATSEVEVRGFGFGDVIHSFNAEMAGCPGIETDGNHIYTVYWNPGTAGRNFDKYTMDGTFVEEFEITGVSAIRDMAYNPATGYFYGAAANTTLREMDLKNKTLVSTITAPVECRAIAFDEINNTLWANNWSTDLTEFDLTGTATGNSFPITTSIYGAAYDKWSDPENPTLWLFNNGENPETIVEYTMDGTATGRQIDITTVPGYAEGGIGGGLASFEADGVAYLLANIQQDPNLIVKFYLVSTAKTYSVTLTINDGTDPIEGATVTFDGVDYTTNVDGIVTIADVANGRTYAYSVSMDGYDTATGNIVVDGADVEQTITLTITGIDNGLLSNLNVYPNPFSSHITITNAEKVNRVVITNLIGQIVKDVTLNGTETINTSELANGIYLVTFEGMNGERAVRKMVKQ